jgi:hypothetical protein
MQHYSHRSMTFFLTSHRPRLGLAGADARIAHAVIVTRMAIDHPFTGRSKQSGTDRVLMIVDQFEEFYTLTTDDVARRRILDELLAASSSPD